MQTLQVKKFKKGSLDFVGMVDVAKPEPGPGQIRIRMQAAALNPADLHIAEGELAMMSPIKPPFALGVDGAGSVDAVGAGVTTWSKGQQVAFYTGLVHCGTLSEYMIVTSDMLAERPEGWSASEAAAGALALLVAKKTLDRAAVQPEEEVLVLGGGGSVGAATIALAGARGAKVTATGSGKDRNYVLGLGAEAFCDYRTDDITAQGKVFDAALDGFGGKMHDQCLAVLKPGGRLVSLKVMTALDDMLAMGMAPNGLIRMLMPLVFRRPVKAAQKARVKLIGLASFQDGRALAGAFAEAGTFRPRIADTYPFVKAEAALQALKTAHSAGKIVVKLG